MQRTCGKKWMSSKNKIIKKLEYEYLITKNYVKSTWITFLLLITSKIISRESIFFTGAIPLFAEPADLGFPSRLIASEKCSFIG